MSPNHTWGLPWRDRDTADKTAYNALSIPPGWTPVVENWGAIRLAFHLQAADQLGGDHLGGEVL